MHASSNDPSSKDRLAQLDDELENFSQIAQYLNPSPGELPRLQGIDVASLAMPLTEVGGGDHVVYVDFKQRYDLEGRAAKARAAGRLSVAGKLERLAGRAGILVADVSGHRMTDAFLAAMLHQAFLVGVNYELELFGEVTTKLFEHLNTRFYKTTAVNKYFTMIYGEISSEGTFRFISSGHRAPMVFSREFGHFARIHQDQYVSFPPVGLLPSVADDIREPSLTGYKRQYEVNELSLMAQGDILLVSTDGLVEHADGALVPDGVEALLRDAGDASAAEICQRLRTAVLDAAPLEDDLTAVVIRRT